MTRQSTKSAEYHYLECGLRNVYLSNGYHELDTPYGKATSIEDVEGLHRVTATSLVNEKPHLTGPEFRFLRKELGFSQKSFAQLVAKTEQAVALWEKTGRVQKWAEVILRQLYTAEKINDDTKLKEMIERINRLDRIMNEKIYFTMGETSGSWSQAA